MASPEEMAASMRNNVLEKTGKTQTQWIKIIAAEKFEKHGQILKHLKSKYSVTHGFANLIAHDYLRSETGSGTGEEKIDLVELQYAGAKQPLKVIYNKLLEKLVKLDDIEIAPKKAYVSLRRNKQFAIVQPSTKTRLDIGINLKGEPETKRLEKSGSFNGMVSHRVRVTDIKEIDKELIDWIKKAYSNS